MRTRASRLYMALIVSVAVLIFTTGCGSSSNSSSTTSSPTPGAPNPPTSGGGTGTGGSGGGSAGGAASTGNTYVYALDQVVQQIAAFKLDESTGNLTAVAGSPFHVTPQAISMTAVPTTSFLYVFDWMAQTIVIYHADANTGALTLTGSTPATGVQQAKLFASPNGKFVFAAENLTTGGSFRVVTFSIGSSGTLTQVSSATVAEPVHFLSSDAQSRLLYASGDNQIFGFTVGSNGSLTPVPGSPVTVRAQFENPDKGPTGISAEVDPGARYVFVSDSTSVKTYVYTVGSDGSLTQIPGSPFNTPGSNGVITTDPAGKFVFEGGFNIVASSIVGSGGVLTAAPGSPFDNGPFLSGGAPVSALVTDAAGKFLLTSNVENSNITVFSINSSNGALTNVNGSPFPVPGHPLGGGSPLTVVITH